MIGYTTPPIELPVARTPKAVARRYLNQCETELAAGKNAIPDASYTIASEVRGSRGRS